MMSKKKGKHHQGHTHSARDRHPLIVDKDLPSSFAESYRTVHTTVHYSLSEKSGKTLLITSSLPQEGKTTTAANLALTIAERGQRVLLVDTDLRIPTVHKIFRHDRNLGLTNALVDIYNTDLTEGDLSRYGLGDLFHVLSIQEKNGLLGISENGDLYHLLFRDGHLIDVQWKNRPQEERVGTLLVESGRITPEQLVRALKRQSSTQERLCSILISMNLISPQDIEGPLKLHISETLQRIYSLKSGTFCFQDRNLPEDHYSIVTGGVDYTHLLESVQGRMVSEKENTPFIDQKISLYLQDSPIDNLKVLNSGPIPSNATELLASRRMSELIDVLKKKFNTIIFDSPPLNSVSDACILSSKVDGVILVICAGRTNRRGVQRAKQQLDNVGAKIFGVILNRLDIRKGDYYYYQYYHYYYGHYEQPKGN